MLVSEFIAKMNEGIEDTQFCGHDLSDYRIVLHNNSRLLATAECIYCNAYVQINSNPLPNQIDISGSIYSTSCKKDTHNE